MVKSMTDSGINVDQVTVTKEAKTGQAFILLDKNGQNSILVYGGANQVLSTKDVDNAKDIIANSDFIITQFETPLAVAEAASRLPRTTTWLPFEPSTPAQEAIPASLLAVSDLVVPNETECQTLTGVEITDEASMIKGAEKLHAMGAKGVIITVGSKGAPYSRWQLRFRRCASKLTQLIPPLPVIPLSVL